MKNRTLILFTLNFPYGVGEEFIENEIKEASQHFSKIVIVPDSISEKIRPIPDNAKVVSWAELESRDESYEIREFMYLFGKELLLQKSQNLARLKSIKVSWNYYKEQFKRAVGIKKLLKKLSTNEQSILLYDFWSTSNALAISLAKESYPKVNYIACTHNFDLYDFRWKCPIPFRGLSMEKIDKIFPDSKYGVEYLKTKIPKLFHSKIELAYMGTPDFGLAPIPTEKIVKIISTSRCIPLKRVDWIIEALSKLKNIKFEWVHFGDGEVCSMLQNKAKKTLPKQSYTFKGWVDFDELVEFYKTTPIDVFVHMSTAEGLPVSLMIASSFGIPIVAVNSMGIPELVNETTGHLLPSDCSIEDATSAIEKTIKTMAKSEKLRKEARNYCMQNFSTENYKEFYSQKLDFKLN